MASSSSHCAIPPPENLSVYPENVTKHWTSSSSGEKPVYYAKEGPASEKEFPKITIPNLFKSVALAKGDKPALKIEQPSYLVPIEALPKNLDASGKQIIPPSEPLDKWKTWTWKEYYDDVRALAKAMIKSGFKQFDSANVFGFNSPQWVISHYASVFAGGKPAGIYPSDTPAQIQYKIDYSDGSVLTLDGQKNFDKVKTVVGKCPYLKVIVSWGELSAESMKLDLKNGKGEKIKIYLWDDFLKLGRAESDDALDKMIAVMKPEQCCILIFTSGTTGQPKAVMISHDSLLHLAYEVITYGTNDFGKLPVEERVISYLPLSHVAGAMVDIICPLIATAKLPSWAVTTFSRPYDLRAGTLVDRLTAVRPTLFLGVPRVWEKMAEKLKIVLGQATGVKAHLARWSMRQGHHYVNGLNFNPASPNVTHLPAKPLLYKLADKLVLSKIRARLGLDQAKFMFSGAAPIQQETLNYMANFGININEVYGMSENSGATTWSTDKCHYWGCVGAPVWGVEAKIFQTETAKNVEAKKSDNPFKPSEAEQGEICSRGRTIMMGYLANPRLGEAHVADMNKKNAEAIDAQGFLHSGDKGTMSVNGFIKITGRYKELIIGAGGENIAPIPIEDKVKELCPYISNFVMIGDKRKFNVALVTLLLEGATGELPGTNRLLKGAFSTVGGKCSTIEEAMKDEQIIKDIESKIILVNQDENIVPSNAAKVQRFMILPRDFSIVTDDFTPTLKLKRGFVTDKFSEIIDLIYDGKANYIPFPMDKFSKYYPA